MDGLTKRGARRMAIALTLVAGCNVGDEAPSVHARGFALTVPDASLYGLHFLPGVVRDPSGDFHVAPRASWMGGESGPRLWDVEMVSGDDYRWFTLDGTCYGNTTCAIYRTLASRNVDLITRFDYYVAGRTVPWDDAGITDWKNRLARVFDDSHGASLARTSHVYIVGNEPNLCLEAGGAAGCVLDGVGTPVDRYAAAYRAMRDELHRLAHGTDVAVLLAGPSNSGFHHEPYLGEQLAQLCNDALDGIALHAYGGDDSDPQHDGTFGFSAALRTQITTIDTACNGRFADVPLFVTEFSRGERAVADSRFVLDVYTWLHDWNDAPGHHAIVAATYFVGRGDFPYENIVDDSRNDHTLARAAFQSAVAASWPAGSSGAPVAAAPPASSTAVSCGAWASSHGYARAACEWHGNGACHGSGPRTDDCDHCCDVGTAPAPAPSCPCRTDVDNYCLYAASTPGCAMTAHGGYCDPDGDGSFSDADWVRGYDEHLARCGAMAPAPSCPCRTDVNNYCLYGASTPGCAMTAHGGYCDPNGDGSFSDADWVRGYDEHAAACH